MPNLLTLYSSGRIGPETEAGIFVSCRRPGPRPARLPVTAHALSSFPVAAFSMVLVEGKSTSKTESFRMGFTPIGEKKTYWSNEIVLGVQ